MVHSGNFLVVNVVVHLILTMGQEFPAQYTTRECIETHVLRVCFSVATTVSSGAIKLQCN